MHVKCLGVEVLMSASYLEMHFFKKGGLMDRHVMKQI